MAKKMMDIALYMLPDEAGEDLLIVDGDFGVVESTAAHQRSLLYCVNGEWKERPDVCVGVQDYKDDENPDELIRKIAQQFMGDGMEFDMLRYDPASLRDSSVKPFIEAYYK